MPRISTSWEVGFLIHKLKGISCTLFSIFFHLWSGGGPNWHKEFDLWCQEQEAEWTLVHHKSRKSYAEIVKSPSVLEVPHQRKSVFTRLFYPKNYFESFFDLSPAWPKTRGRSDKHVQCWRPKLPAPPINSNCFVPPPEPSATNGKGPSSAPIPSQSAQDEHLVNGSAPSSSSARHPNSL